MTDITIPPEALEAVAKSICLGMGNNPDVLSCDGSGRVVWMCWEAEARAVCIAMLKAWPGMETKGTPMFPTLIRTIILPLPKENPDAES